MKRRTAIKQLMTAGVIGLSGCVRPPTASSDTQSTPSEDIQRRVSITGEDSIPGKYQLQIEATMLESTVTDSHTSRIRITLTNKGSARGISVHPTGRCALFHKQSQSSNPRGIWLAPVEGERYVAGPGWIADPPEDGSFPDYGCSLRAYESEESVDMEYEIHHDNRTSGYMDSGTYRFQETVFATPGQSNEEWDRDADASFTVPWGFSLSIKNPNCTLIC